MDSPEVSIVLPAFNEGPAIADAVTRYTDALRHLDQPFELILVDDGSTDDTQAEAMAVASENPNVRLLCNPTNRGQVASLLRGFSCAAGRYVTHNGIDLPFDPRDTAALLEEHAMGADVVVVERTNRKAYGLTRKVLSWGHSAMVRGLLGSPFVDHNFVQSFLRDHLVATPVLTRGVTTVTTELILKAVIQGLEVRSLQVTYHPRALGSSSISARKVAHTALELVRLARVLRKWRRSAELERMNGSRHVAEGHGGTEVRRESIASSDVQRSTQ